MNYTICNSFVKTFPLIFMSYHIIRLIKDNLIKAISLFVSISKAIKSQILSSCFTSIKCHCFDLFELYVHTTLCMLCILIFMCMFICIYICIYMYIYMIMHTHIYIYTLKNTYTIYT